MIDSRIHLQFLIPDISAGTGFFCMTLGGGLKRWFGNEFRVTLLLMRHRDFSPQEQASFDAIEFIGLPVRTGWRRIFETPRDFFAVRRRLRQDRPDVLFTIASYSNLLAAASLGPANVIMSEHMNVSGRLAVAPFAGCIRLLMKRYYRRAMMIVAARGIAEDLRCNFGVQRIELIPNGIDGERVRRLADEPMPALPTSRPFFVAVGRLSEQKDYPTLLRAFALAIRGGLLEDLLILGDGEERPKLEALIRDLRLEGRAHLLGHCANPYPIIRGSLALVLSSKFEGFAYVPLEAMALDVPCICTDCPSGPADILEDGRYGLLVPPQDPPALSAALLRLAKEPGLRDDLARKSAERGRQLTIERMAREYRDVFVREYERKRDERRV